MIKNIDINNTYIESYLNELNYDIDQNPFHKDDILRGYYKDDMIIGMYCIRMLYKCQ